MSGAKVSGVDNVDYKGFSESTTRNPSKIEQNSDYILNSKSNPDGRSSSSDSLDNNSNAKGKTKSIPKGRIFQCTGYPECNMSFTRSEHLARHKRKHTGERPFTCLHCAKSFSRLDNLRQHQQTVHAYEKVAASNLQKDQVLAKGSSKPKTPSSAYFNVKDEGNHNDTNALLSPPNSSSPQHRHHLQTTQDSNGYPQVYQHSTTSLASPSYSINRSSTGSLQNHLIQTIPEFKPKRRPKPLSLAHSFLDDNREASSDSHSLNLVGGYLQSAPPIPTQSFHPSPYPTSSVLYVPKSASLTPKTSSPFSPLFHQSFKQINSKGIHVPSIPHNHRYESRYRGGMTYSNQLPKKSPKLPLSHLLNERDVDPGMNQGESDQK